MLSETQKSWKEVPFSSMTKTPNPKQIKQNKQDRGFFDFFVNQIVIMKDHCAHQLTLNQTLLYPIL